MTPDFPNQYHAYCWRSGLIEFGTFLPDGAIPITSGTIHDRYSIIERVRVRARHGWDDQLLVPGVPEAEDDDAALDALLAWRAWACPEGRTAWEAGAADVVAGAA